MKTIVYFILLLSVVIALFSCGKVEGNCGDPLPIGKSDIILILKDSLTGRYLYSAINPLYNKDSLRIDDSKGDSVETFYKYNKSIALCSYVEIS